MQTIVNIHEAKAHLSHFMNQAAAGEEIVLARAGKPIARLMPLPSKTSRTLGLGKGIFSLPATFDEMNAQEIRNMFEIGK